MTAHFDIEGIGTYNFSKEHFSQAEINFAQQELRKGRDQEDIFIDLLNMMKTDLTELSDVDVKLNRKTVFIHDINLQL